MIDHDIDIGVAVRKRRHHRQLLDSWEREHRSVRSADFFLDRFQRIVEDPVGCPVEFRGIFLVT